MAIKELAFSAKQHLNSVTGQQFKQSHVYELLAACNGFKSSASLNSHHVFATLDYEPEGVELEPISSADEAEAKKLAAELFRNIGAKGAFGMMDSTTGSFV